MERLVDQFIYLDTNCFIYLLEDHLLFGERANRIFMALENGKF
jgi:predicted nucleic acid-binding protein